MNENDPRLDLRRNGVAVIGLRRCPGCRRRFDPATKQRWVSEGVIFPICANCRLQARSDLAVADRVFHGVADFLEMDAALAEYRRDHADVL
ncbi:MAG: hypothetical protein V1790_05990 [Planctomycetota bacterium]